MKIECPHCSQKLDVDSAFCGQNANCPQCNGVFTIPVPVAVSVDNAQPPKETEKTFYTGKPCLICWFFSLLIGWILLFVGVLVCIFESVTFGLCVFVCGLFLLLRVKIIRSHTKYTVTNKRVIYNGGVFNPQERTIRIRDIKSVDLQKNFLDGTYQLSFATAGTDSYEMLFCGMDADAANVKKYIEDILNR